LTATPSNKGSWQVKSAALGTSAEATSKTQKQTQEKKRSKHNSAVITVCFFMAVIAVLGVGIFGFKARRRNQRHHRYCLLWGAGQDSRAYEIQDNGLSSWADVSINHGSAPESDIIQAAMLPSAEGNTI